jgi:hypothetical protein
MISINGTAISTMEVPPVPSHHPCYFRIFHEINHPFGGTSILESPIFEAPIMKQEIAGKPHKGRPLAVP